MELENNVFPIRQCKLTCVEFPALVENEHRMLEMIGGQAAVSKAYSSSTKRLELNWRPGELYNKPAYGDRMPATCMMMKITRRKRVRPDGSVYRTMDVQVSGPILSMYKFIGMVDYQYLPMTREGNQYRSLREDLILSRLETTSWLNKPAPLFLVPVYFSRIDQPVTYAYRKEPALRKTNTSQRPSLLGISRERRLHHTISYSYGDPVPSAAQPEAWNNLSTKELEHGRIEELRTLFEERPIWSRNALLLRYKGCPNKLKFLLPVVGYYCLSGPWRTFWIRYAYDPRENVDAKIYQTLDYRIRQRAGEKLSISSAKRSPYSYALPTKTSKRALAARTSHFKLGKEVSLNDGKSMKGDMLSVYRPGRMPPYRQMFYQICDVLCDEVQILVHENDGKETICTEKDGWCLPDTIAKCRAILAKHVDKVRDEKPLLKFFECAKHGHSRRHIDAKRNLRTRKKIDLFDENTSENENEEMEEEEEGEEEAEETNEMVDELVEHVTGVSTDELT